MSEIKHKHVFSRLDFIPRFCWQCGVAEIDGTFYYPSFQFDKLKEQNEKLNEALKAIVTELDNWPHHPTIEAIDKIVQTLKSCE